MSKKTPLSSYDKQRATEFAQGLFGAHALSQGMTIMPYLEEDKIQQMKNTHLLQHVLMFSSPNELVNDLAKVDWNSVVNPCALLFASARKDAFMLAPIQWWNSSHAIIPESDARTYKLALFGKRVVEPQWLVYEFITGRACAKMANTSISSNIRGADLAQRAQNTLWEVLTEKGLMGSTRVHSCALGFPHDCKMLDIALVYAGDVVVERLLPSTDFSVPGAAEETLLALNALPQESALKEKVVRALSVRPLDWSAVWGGQTTFHKENGISFKKQEPSLPFLGAVLLLVGGEQNPTPAVEALQKSAFKAFAVLPTKEQKTIARWMFELGSRQLSGGRFLDTFVRLLPHAKASVQDTIVGALINGQQEENLFVFATSDNPLTPLQGMATVLSKLSNHRSERLDETFVNWALGTVQSDHSASAAAARQCASAIAPWIKPQNRALFEDMLARLPCPPKQWKEALRLQSQLDPTSVQSRPARKM